jgi:D-3-phosphoglycerate dehydrogenase
MKKNVLLLETIAPEALLLLTEAKNAAIFTAYGEKPLAEILAENRIDAVITRGKGQVNQALLEACPALQVAARCGVGLDNVDVGAATARKIKVVNAPGINSATIAEHAIALMLMLQRNLYRSLSEVKTGNWEWRNSFKGDELNGKVLGILGLGNIGKRVAKIADALGMKVVYWDAVQAPADYPFLSLAEVLRQADVVSIHLPLVKETNQLIDEKALAQMKPTALLINTARGQIIDQAALLKALDNQTIAGFGADVLAVEPPPPDDPLLRHPRTHITAHVGSLTATTYVNMCVQTVNNVLAILAGHEPQVESVFNRKDL